MDDNKPLWAYETMIGQMESGYEMPCVEDAFTDGSFCAECYDDAMDACARLAERLDVSTEDADIQRILSAYESIQRELCLRMYFYGAKFGE